VGLKGKQANGVGTQLIKRKRQVTACPALLPTIKIYDMLPSSMVGLELSCNIRELVSTSLFPYNTFLAGIKTKWNVDTVSSLLIIIIIIIIIFY
jgi:hypothetical protein